jgi:hypothetical protein
MRARLWLVLLFAAACGAGGDEGPSELPTLPSAGVGPFRDLQPTEVKGIAPFVLEDAVSMYGEPAVWQDGATTYLYASAQAGELDVIVRTRATDARTFFGASSSSIAKPAVVLRPDQPWEGRYLGGPTLVEWRGQVLLFYSGVEGIGAAVARAPGDLRTFQKLGPVLGPDGRRGTWETSPPRAPTVYVLPDGRLRMLYTSGAAIGEAESHDGVTWARLGTTPVLGPSGPSGTTFDAAGASDPCAVTRTTASGRFVVRVLYTGTNASGVTAIGFAGRFGDAGDFERGVDPVYAVAKKETAPALLELGGESFLYIQEELRSGDKTWPAIAAAVAPAVAVLPKTSAFPTEP